MIDVVVVNWNSGEFLERCLCSIGTAGRSIVKSVVVVDNCSSDQSRGQAKGFHSDAFAYRYIENEANRGFAVACNQGARCGDAEFLLFLNPDCELYPTTLKDTLAEMATLSDRAYDVAGIQLLDSQQRVWRTCSRQPTAASFWVTLLGLDRLTGGPVQSHIMREWDHCTSRDVEHVMGAFYLIRRRLFEKLGGFDERFFVYLEDLDLSRRVLHAGGRIRYLSQARALHAGGGSSKNVKARRLFYSLKSRALFCFKNCSAAGAWSVLAGTLLFEPVVRLAYALLRLDFRAGSETVQGYALLVRDLPRWITTRR